MKLHGYFRSSAAYRVRIALNLKGIPVEHAFVHLRRNQQNSEDYRRINPMGLVPTLEDNGHCLSQSLAIIEYLEEVHPLPRLLPVTAEDRAYVRSLALGIVCDIHPLNNLRVLNYLSESLRIDATQKDQWYAHWIAVGLRGIEDLLAHDVRVGTYCCGDSPGLADVCLVPQVFNAERMNCDLSGFPTIVRIVSAARQLPAFAAAAPERQSDANS